MQPTFSLTGELYIRSETINKGSTEKPFHLRTFAIRQETRNPDYPNYIKFQLINDRCDLIRGFKKGETITVFFDVKGNLSVKDGSEMIFTNLSAWKILAGTHTSPAGNSRTSAPMPDEKDEPKAQAQPEPETVESGNDEDLPF